MAPSTYNVGDKVEYHPIGGASDNVSSSTGTIESYDEENEKYHIKNDNTGKTTAYDEKNIVGSA